MESFVRSILGEEITGEVDFSTLQDVSSNYVTPDNRQRYGDMVWKVRRKDGCSYYLVLMMEFQSTVYYRMAVRMLVYTSLLIEDLIQKEKIPNSELLPQIIPIVIYNGAARWTAPLGMTEQFPAVPEAARKYQVALDYFLLDESQVPMDKLERDRGLVSQWIRIGRESEPEKIREILKELHVMLGGPECRDELRRVFSQCLMSRVERQVGMELGVDIERLESPLEVEEAMNQRIAEMREESKQEGIGIGIAEGAIVNARKGLLELVEEVFGEVPDQLVAMVSEIKDVGRLHSLLRKTVRVNTLDEFMGLVRLSLQ